MKGITLKSISYYLFLFGTFLLAVSLAWSNFLMSNAQIILLISWLIGGEIPSKLRAFANNKIALIVISVFVLHLIGLAYTSDFTYAFEDIRKKVPLLLLPLIFSTSPTLAKDLFDKILALFVFSVSVASFICFGALLGFTNKPILQPMDASLFISHIRFSLLISVAIFVLAYFFKKNTSIAIKIVSLMLITWFVAFLIMMESATGLICTGVTALLLIARYIFTIKNIYTKVTLGGIIILVLISVIKLLLSSEEKSMIKINLSSLPSATKSGNIYSHDTLNQETENRNLIWINVCEKELAEEWKKRSNIPYQGKDLKGNELKFTLIRFLASKNIRKDAEGLNSLSDEEIKAIEKGIPNENYVGIFNPTARIRKIRWEFDTYRRGGNPSGHSVVQRLEFWKASLGIIKENLLFGVGTGDVETALADQYEKINSPLKKEARLHSHNQFLSIGIAFGITGMIWFLVSLFYALTKSEHFDYLYITFFIIALLSMLAEDTLESQAGVTFFAFFNSIYLFCRKK